MSDLRLDKGCCTDGTALVGMISPWSRVLSLDHGGQHDPVPMAGLMQCHDCGQCCRFARLDAFNGVNVYGVAKMPKEAFQQLVDRYAKVAKPKWPLWVPPGDHQLKVSDYESVNSLELQLWSRSGPMHLVVALKALVNGRVLGATEYDAAISDWRSSLGL